MGVKTQVEAEWVTPMSQPQEGDAKYKYIMMTVYSIVYSMINVT